MEFSLQDALFAAAQQASHKAGVRITHDVSAAMHGGLCAARYRLDNGLTIVFVQDDRAPVFAYNTWFKVGSRDEDPSRTGLAHLFEHLMFKGTKKYATGTFDREMERRGTQTNAATWVDWTYYHEALAARGDNLRTVVDFETDRMTGLILDESTFRSELEVVKNERRMSVEDSVMGSLSEKLFALAFEKHPYRWPTIGAMAHLEASTLGDLERFYRTFYAPNNAVVLVVGALDPVDTLALLASAYGPIAAQSVPVRTYPKEPPQRAPRLLRVDKPVLAPQLIFGYRAPPELDDKHEALNMLSEVLVAGDGARLYQRLVVKDEIAADIQGSTLPFADPSLYEITVTLRPGVDPLVAIEAVQEEVSRLEKGLSEAEVEKAKNGLLLAFHERFKSAESTAELLGHFESNYGDFRLALAGEERIARVDARQLAATAREVFAVSNRNVVIADPVAA